MIDIMMLFLCLSLPLNCITCQSAHSGFSYAPINASMEHNSARLPLVQEVRFPFIFDIDIENPYFKS